MLLWSLLNSTVRSCVGRNRNAVIIVRKRFEFSATCRQPLSDGTVVSQQVQQISLVRSGYGDTSRWVVRRIRSLGAQQPNMSGTDQGEPEEKKPGCRLSYVPFPRSTSSQVSNSKSKQLHLPTLVPSSYVFRLYFQVVTCANTSSKQLRFPTLIPTSYICQLQFQVVR